MDCRELLKSLESDHMARLRHVVLTRLNICPLSLRARLISDRRIIACACQLALDRAGPEAGGGDFDMARFLELKERGA